MKNILILNLILVALFTFVSIANCQKLPGIQKQSIKVPANVKIDGKAIEWGDKFQAYNHAIQAFYTVANDNKKLYLVVKTDKREIINKIINGGVSLTVITNGKKDKEKGPTFTYPVFDRLNHPVTNLVAMSEIKADEKDAEKKTDSLLSINNASLEEKAKFIRVNGVSDLDTLISIYNIDGIEARSAFDSKGEYIVEMSIDLKLFKVSVNNINSFNYNITLNGVPADFVPGIDIKRDESGTITSIDITSKIADVYSGALSATDCWGTYTLAK